MERHILDLLLRYGSFIVFFAQMLGIFGLPIPDEVLLTIAGALIRRGQLHTASTVAAAISGCIAGITLSYMLGRTVGLVALRRVLHIREESLDRVRAWFRRFGCWLLVFGYFVPGVRHVTALAAGSAPIEFRAFASYAYPGGVLWSTTFVALGYFAGDRWHQVAAAARTRLAMGALVLVAIGAIYAFVWRREQT